MFFTALKIKKYKHITLFISAFLICFSIKIKAQEQCLQSFQLSIGGPSDDIANLVVDAGNNQFFTAGTTTSFGAGGLDILVTKMSVNGNLLWSKTYGAAGNETVRKISLTPDGGLVMIGQTSSFAFSHGEIFCLRIDKDGQLLWSRRFGLSPDSYGDIGLDIIQTSDGGYAFTGLLNAAGQIADLAIAKLDANANIIWFKRLNSSQAEDGTGILQEGNNLVVTTDLDNNGTNYSSLIMRLKMADGAILSQTEIKPGARGLFAPHLYKDNSTGGYVISGHTIDQYSYAQMQPTILKLDANFNIIKAFSYRVPGVYTNDYYTGFTQMSNGFITCASTTTNPSGYLFYINDDGSVKWSKKFKGKKDRSLYDLKNIGNKVITVGRDNSLGKGYDLFVAGFSDDGFIDSHCHPDTSDVTVTYPAFTQAAFSWGNINDQSFSNISAPITITNVTLTKNSLCDACTSTTVVPSFNIPDTVCVNSPVNITNTTTGATSYYWSFCSGDLNQAPAALNLGNPNAQLSQPVFMDIAFQNDKYYGFLVNHHPGALIRLDFGNSLLNAPVATNLGNFGGIIPPNYGAEGIQIVQNEGKWYAIVVGGYPPSGSTPRILKIDFGVNLSNPTPVATDWGAMGSMSQPIDLNVFKQGNNWYGLTVNAENNTITRFDFTSSFENTPTAVNMGNIGKLDYPTGIFAIDDDGYWRVFVTNAGITNGGNNPSLSRLDFGNSLLNTPVGVNLGSLGGTLVSTRDIAIIKSCGGATGFIANGTNNDVVKLNFPNGLGAAPEAISLGNTGNLSIAHSLSKLFRVGADIYTFITNVGNNTITRLQFKGCTNSSVPNSSSQNPPPVTYSTPGVYNINLTVDDSLPTQNSICKQVVVLGGPKLKLSNDTTICKGDSAHLVASGGVSYKWLPTATLSNPNAANTFANPASTTKYFVTAKNAFGCSSTDSVQVKVNANCNTGTDCVPTFEKIYGGNKAETGNSIVTNADGSSVIAGSINSFGGLEGYLQKIDVNGKIMWSRVIGGAGDDNFYKLNNTKDGGYIAVGNTRSFGGSDNGVAWMVKVDAAGNLQWTRKYDDGNPDGSVAWDVIQTLDDGYAISGTNNFTPGHADAMVIKTDNNGNVQWAKNFQTQNSDNSFGLLEDGGGLVVSAFQYDLNSTLYNGVVMKLNLTDGSIVWARNYDIEGKSNWFSHIYKTPAGYAISVYDDNSFSITQPETVIVSTDKNGAPLSITKITDNVPRLPGALAPTSDGGFVITQNDNNGDPDAYLIKINSSNKLQWVKKLPGAGAQVMNDIKQLPDNSYIAAGSYNSTPTEADSSDVFVIKTDSTGDVKGCSPLVASVLVSQAAYNYNPAFSWTTVTNLNFSQTSVTAGTEKPLPGERLICGACIVDSIVTCTAHPDFSFSRDVCNPATLQFNNETPNTSSVSWDFGNGQTAGNNLTPSTTYNTQGIYAVKLVVVTTSGCTDSITKNTLVDIKLDSVITTNDTALCNNATLQLNTLPALSYCWSPSAGLSATNIANPVATIKKDVTYYVNAQTSGANLIVNGDFSLGNQGFTSSYQYAATNTTEGQYFVGNNPSNWNFSTRSCADHTGNNGNMMMVNGNPTANLKVWSEKVTVQPNTNYAFSAWLESIYPVNPAELQFYINGKEVGQVFSADATPCTWKQFFITWNSGDSTTANISIINKNTAVQGNDFALDDISFAQTTIKRDSVIVKASKLFVTTLADSSICSGKSIVLTSASVGNPIYSWLPSAGLSDASKPSPVASPLATTTYVVQVKDSVGCTANDSVTVSVTPQPSVTTLADTTICSNTALQLATTAVNGNTYKWSPANGLSNPYVINPVATLTGNTQYIITVNPGTQCIAKDTVNIAVNISPMVQASGDSTLCTGASEQLSSTSPDNVTYSWSPAASLSDPSIPNPIATPLTTTKYYVQVADNNQCTSIDSVLVQVIPQPVFAVDPRTAKICVGEKLLLTASGGDVYQWSPANSVANPNAASTQVFPVATTTYQVIITNNICKITDTVISTIDVSDRLISTIRKSNDIDCNTLQTNLEATGGNQYTWSPATGLSNPHVSNPVATPLETTTYHVTIKNEHGCVSEDTVQVKVSKGDLQINYRVISAFTPNGDGVNDCFGLKYWGGVEGLQFEVYNRWGNRIFHSSDPSACWDGTYKGVAQPPGTYVYQIQATTHCGVVYRKGTVVLIR